MNDLQTAISILSTGLGSRSQLARACGVTPQAVYLWKNGKRFPDYSSLIQLLAVAEKNKKAETILKKILDEKYPSPPTRSNECNHDAHNRAMTS